jgi:hypothetical protein
MAARPIAKAAARTEAAETNGSMMIFPTLIALNQQTNVNKLEVMPHRYKPFTNRIIISWEVRFRMQNPKILQTR